MESVKDLINYEITIKKAEILHKIYELLYNSLLKIKNAECETLIYGSLLDKHKYYVTYPSETKDIAKKCIKKYEKLLYDFNNIDISQLIIHEKTDTTYWNQQAKFAKTEYEKLNKIHIIFDAIVKISHAEIVYFPNGFFNELERCYYTDTCKIANYTLSYINKIIS